MSSQRRTEASRTQLVDGGIEAQGTDFTRLHSERWNRARVWMGRGGGGVDGW
jgi:hypothetical protein